jgi:hypothetical protein
MSTASIDVLQRALAAHQAGRLAVAEQGARAVLARDAKHADHRADFHNSLGDAFRVLGQLPEAVAAFPHEGALAFIDFFSMSGCRDLLMHVQERSYTLPEIARDLDTLKLRFLGFRVPATVQARFHAEYPGQWLELSAWDAFETAHPDTFAAMYQFWCCPL